MSKYLAKDRVCTVAYWPDVDLQIDGVELGNGLVWIDRGVSDEPGLTPRKVVNLWRAWMESKGYSVRPVEREGLLAAFGWVFVLAADGRSRLCVVEVSQCYRSQRFVDSKVNDDFDPFAESLNL